MRKVTIGVFLLLISVGLLVPVAFSANTTKIVVTYGETTYNNNNYKTTVDNYFSNQINEKLSDINVKIISANDVNKISSGISNKTYSSNQIFSSALVDLTSSDDIKVHVDSSKINTITPDMYKSALKSAGITKGHVYVTSPVSATGESALAGVMNCYEQATNTTIPNDVKQAANDEIYTEAKIVNNSNVSADDLSKIVSECKNQVDSKNVNNHQEIVNIINNVANNYNVNLSTSDVNSLADSINQTHSVQDSANNYKDKLSSAVNSDNPFSFINEILGYLHL